MTAFFLLLAAGAVLAAAAVILWERRRTRKTLQALDNMLEEAIRGDFRESAWDESRLSALEAKLARYLKNAALSQRDLREKKAQIETLVADISHQTKTPLANILLYAQLLEEQELTGEARMLVSSLIGQTETLRTHIEALVKASRLETGILRFTPRPVELPALIGDLADAFEPAAQKKRITIYTSDASVPGLTALCDPKWTAEALGNILDNAIKYAPEDSAVMITVKAYEMFLRVDIEDAGPGIREEEQAKVFQRFYRSNATAEAEGVGLGLYLAREIVAGQGGYLKLESETGKGSTFSIFLPRTPLPEDTGIE